MERMRIGMREVAGEGGQGGDEEVIEGRDEEGKGSDG